MDEVKNLIRARIKDIEFENDWLDKNPSFVSLIARLIKDYEEMVAAGYIDISYSYNLDYNNYITFSGYRPETEKELQARVKKLQTEHDREYKKFLELKAKFEDGL